MTMIDLPSTKLSDARAMDDEALIRLIMQYHDAHIRDLTAAVELAEAVAFRHGGSPDFPDRLPETLERTLAELREHQAREEAVLFPVILGGGGEALRYPIAALGSDHELAQAGLEGLVRLTADFTPPDHACATWRRLYDLCRKFDHDFREHIRLEELVLFPRFR